MQKSVYDSTYNKPLNRDDENDIFFKLLKLPGC
jgi:hypothetical protein